MVWLLAAQGQIAQAGRFGRGVWVLQRHVQAVARRRYGQVYFAVVSRTNCHRIAYLQRQQIDDANGARVAAGDKSATAVWLNFYGQWLQRAAGRFGQKEGTLQAQVRRVNQRDGIVTTVGHQRAPSVWRQRQVNGIHACV